MKKRVSQNMNEIIKKILKTLVLVFLWIVIFDVGSQILLKIIDNERLNSYFSYGLSTETQIRDLLTNDKTENSILNAGWIDRNALSELGTKADISIYGMSFTEYFVHEFEDSFSGISIRSVAAPAAPLSHSISSFLIDKDVCQSTMVVLGILDHSLKFIDSCTNDTIGVDVPMGYFYPRYIYDDGLLEQYSPIIDSCEKLKAVVDDGELWDENITFLRAYDDYYSPIIYQSNILDYSITGRFLKRWYKERHNHLINKKFYSASFFGNDADKLIKAMIKLFADESKAKGFVPVVLMIETARYNDMLSKAFNSFLDKEGILHINTSDIIDIDDPASYSVDGHYTREGNKKVALEIYKYYEESQFGNN